MSLKHLCDGIAFEKVSIWKTSKWFKYRIYPVVLSHRLKFKYTADHTMGRARMEALGRHNKYVGEMFSEGNYPDGWLLVCVFLLLFVLFYCTLLIPFSTSIFNISFCFTSKVMLTDSFCTHLAYNFRSFLCSLYIRSIHAHFHSLPFNFILQVFLIFFLKIIALESLICPTTKSLTLFIHYSVQFHWAVSMKHQITFDVMLSTALSL